MIIKNGKRFRVAALIAAAAVLAALPGAAAERTPLSVLGSSVAWSPAGDYGGLVLTVAGGDFRVRQEFGSGESPVFDAAGLPDGTYKWELTYLPRLRDLRGADFAHGEVSADGAVVRDGKTPRGRVDSGVFTIANGSLVDPGAVEGERPRTVSGTRISGDLVASGAKSFVAVDPADGARAIYYAALEGPEAGTYFRGNARTVDGVSVIELPGHFAKVTGADGLTVQLTPLGAWSGLYVAELSPERLVVHDAQGGDGIEFSFLVQGVRAGYEDFQVERPAGPSDRN